MKRTNVCDLVQEKVHGISDAAFDHVFDKVPWTTQRSMVWSWVIATVDHHVRQRTHFDVMRLVEEALEYPKNDERATQHQKGRELSS